MKFFFDYFYYRITKLFVRYPTDQGVRALFLISLMQSMILLSVIQGCFVLCVERAAMAGVLKLNNVLIFLVVFGAFFLNYRKYHGRYTVLNLYWQNEPKEKKNARGILIVFSFIASFIIYVFITSLIYDISKMG
jgi:hypothetical protein